MEDAFAHQEGLWRRLSPKSAPWLRPGNAKSLNKKSRLFRSPSAILGKGTGCPCLQGRNPDIPGVRRALLKPIQWMLNMNYKYILLYKFNINFNLFKLIFSKFSQVGFTRKLALRWRLVCKRVFRGALGINSCGWEGKKGGRIGQRESWAVMLSQWRPQPIWVLKMGWPFTVVLSWGEGLDFHVSALIRY